MIKTQKAMGYSARRRRSHISANVAVVLASVPHTQLLGRVYTMCKSHVFSSQTSYLVLWIFHKEGSKYNPNKTLSTSKRLLLYDVSFDFDQRVRRAHNGVRSLSSVLGDYGLEAVLWRSSTETARHNGRRLRHSTRHSFALGTRIFIVATEHALQLTQSLLHFGPFVVRGALNFLL